jgi:hypothetical protein
MSSLTIQNYTTKSFVVRGDTINHNDYLQNNHGRLNPNLHGGSGWIFSNKHLDKITLYINNQNLSERKTQPSTQPSTPSSTQPSTPSSTQQQSMTLLDVISTMKLYKNKHYRLKKEVHRLKEELKELKTLKTKVKITTRNNTYNFLVVTLILLVLFMGLFFINKEYKYKLNTNYIEKIFKYNNYINYIKKIFKYNNYINYIKKIFKYNLDKTYKFYDKIL